MPAHAHLSPNALHCGDNLPLMKALKDHSIDLIYLDPPFNSQRNYKIAHKGVGGQEVSEQKRAFCDTWAMDAEKQDLLDNMTMTMARYKVDTDFAVSWTQWMNALKKTRGDMTAYLLYMAVRLLDMRRVLKDTGSLYLHCDPHASHYIKVLMDGVFGHERFRNEIVWSYRTGGVGTKHFPKKHDILLHYAKQEEKCYHCAPKEVICYEKPFFQKKKVMPNKEGKYEVEVFVRDVWEDIKPVLNVSKERLGYPTQKPKNLLKRIVQASCPKGGVVLDPFCGCGTTLYATEELNRQKNAHRHWIGMDMSLVSIRLVRDQLETQYDLLEGRDFALLGMPSDLLEQAQQPQNRFKNSRTKIPML